MHFIFSVPSDPHAGLGAVARLRLGISLEEAPQNIGSIGRALAHDFPPQIVTVSRRRTSCANRPWGLRAKIYSCCWLAALLFMLIGCRDVSSSRRMPEHSGMPASISWKGRR